MNAADLASILDAVGDTYSHGPHEYEFLQKLAGDPLWDDLAQDGSITVTRNRVRRVEDDEVVADYLALPDGVVLWLQKGEGDTLYHLDTGNANDYCSHLNEMRFMYESAGMNEGAGMTREERKEWWANPPYVEEKGALQPPSDFAWVRPQHLDEDLVEYLQDDVPVPIDETWECLTES